MLGVRGCGSRLWRSGEMLVGSCIEKGDVSERL
jgi:hypothetical protein